MTQADTPTRLREPMHRLLLSARILLQNAKGCAKNHYGNDTELNGLPGWLADCENDIAAGEIELSAQSAEVERLTERVAALRATVGHAAAYVHHWQVDKAHELKPTDGSLSDAAAMFAAALAKDATP